MELSAESATSNGTNATEAYDSTADTVGVTVWYVGVVLKLAGSALATLGINLQRWRHRRNGRGIDGAADLSFFAHRVWWIGFVLLASDSVLGFLAYAFASLSKLAPLGTITLVLNNIIAPACLGQPARQWDKQAAVLVVFGAVLAISCADARTPDYVLDALLALLGQPHVLVYLCSLNTILIALLGLGSLLDKRREKVEAERRRLRVNGLLDTSAHSHSHSAPTSADSISGNESDNTSTAIDSEQGRRYSAAGDTSYSDDSEVTASGASRQREVKDYAETEAESSSIALDIEARLHESVARQNYPIWLEELHSLVLPTAAGMAGGQAVMFSKITVEMAKSTILAFDDPFVRVPAYILGGCMGLCLALQIWLLNRALVTFQAFNVVAVYQAVWVVICILGGILVFGDGGMLPASQNIGFAVGCALCVIGTLATRRVGYRHPVVEQSTGRSTGLDRPDPTTRDDLDDMLQLLDIDTTTRNWTLVELRQQIVLEKATAARLRAEIEEKDARITMFQLGLCVVVDTSS